MKGDETSGPPNVTPLRTILQNFLNLVENCEAGRNSGDDAYEKEFHELKQYSEDLKCDPDYQCKEGEKSVNRKKNRYKDILPFDYTRVGLTDYGDIPGSDYINANFIKGASGSSAYIACQGPLSHTVNDFWRMVVECEVQVVVMACMEQESGKHKCENYWVEDDDVEKQFGDVTVWLKKCRNVCPDFLVRTMRIRFTNSRGEKEERNVCQFHYSAWPDHGVPTKVRPLLDMVRLIRDCQTSETLPVLVHCSAGCGRTGTICAIDYVWGLLRLGKLTPDFSLFQLVRDMRRQRIAMVQTKDQYILVHRAVKELFQDQLKIIEAHCYANVDQNGLPFEIKQELEEPTYETIEFVATGARSSPDLNARGDSASDKSRISNTKSKNEGSTSRLKLKKEIGNRKEKHKEQYHEKVRGSRPPEPMPPGINDIQIDGIEKYDCTDRAVELTKVIQPSASPTRSSLIRKPSIGKIRSFFEKSPKGERKEKKSSTGHLSRAKSDVSSSSRFYSFASAFGGSRGQLSGQSNNNNEPVLLKSTARSDSPTKEKVVNGKPPLMVKPTLPIKRSKSLKVHPVEHSAQPSKISTEKTLNCSVKSSKSKASPSSSGFSAISPNNPIKVCVKQVDMPKLQTVVSSSVKPEPRTALLNSCNDNKNKEMYSRSEIESPPRKPFSSLKPQKENHNYVNITYGNNRIKMGIAKEMEDLSDFESSKRSSKLGKIKKYDTVNPRFLAGSDFGESDEFTGTTLTRSQSHVWQPERINLSQLDRIFSDENINQKSLRGNSGRKESQQKLTTDGISRIPTAGGISQRLNVHSNMLRSPPLDKPIPLNINSVSFHSINTTFLDEPIVRHRVPKTNPYTNFPCTGTERHSPAFLRVANSQVEETQMNPSERLNGLPQLTGCFNGISKINGNHSVGNSSDSSSNAGTPRNSLPSTPTESIDVLYPHLMRSTTFNGNEPVTSSPKIQRIGYNGGTPKSILKGSLTSTPSESDERLNCSGTTRLLGHISSNLGSTSHSPLRVGIRERRNSFRQAVWKEAAQDSQQQQHQYSGQLLYSSSALVNQNPKQPLKSHKDYEPIWPDGSPCTSSKTFLHVSALNGGLGSQPVTPRHNGSSLYPSNTSRPTEDNIMGNELPNERTTGNAPFQSRMDEIKLLLKELKSPIGAAESSPSRQPVNHLKYQRSLKAPSRAHYQQSTQDGNSLSCFTSKKVSSLESITDQLNSQSQTEEYQPLLTPPKAIKMYGHHSGEQHESPQRYDVHHAGSHGYDYVTLQNCRGSDYSQGGFKIEGGEDLIAMKRTPIPPPRTKARKVHQSVSNIEARDSVEKPNSSVDINGRSPGLSLWSGKTSNNQNRSMGRESTVESKEDESGYSRPNGAVTSSSPKALVRAIGLFQAKAASVRSKFANWAETKERNNYQSRRGQLESISNETSHILRDQSDNQEDDDSGFASSIRQSSTMSQIGPSRSTKHQYL